MQSEEPKRFRVVHIETERDMYALSSLRGIVGRSFTFPPPCYRTTL